MRYKCFNCNNPYEEFDYSKYAEDHLCPDCSRKKGMSTLVKMLIGVSIIIALILSIYFVAGQNITDNLTCTGTSCALDSNYSYEANIKDPNCWHKINFCNLEFPLNASTTNSYQVMILLKQINYQQQADVAMYKSKYESNQYTIYIIIGFVVIVAIWNIFLLSKIRKLKNGK